MDTNRIGACFLPVLALLTVLLLVLPVPGWCGDLDDFEEAATEPGSDDYDPGNETLPDDNPDRPMTDSTADEGAPDPSESVFDDDENTEGDAIASLLVYGSQAAFALPVILGLLTENSFNLATGKGVAMKEALPDGGLHSIGVYQRSPGDRFVPFFRFSTAALLVNKDIWGVGAIGEAGYGPIALKLSHLQFFERHPEDILNASSAILVWRLALPPQVEMDLGLGVQLLNGNEMNWGLNLALSIKYSPVEWFTLEINPEIWTFSENNGVFKIEGSLLLNFGWFSVRGGYLALLANNSALGGPFLGAEIRY